MRHTIAPGTGRQQHHPTGPPSDIRTPPVRRSETVGVGFEALKIFQTPPAPQPNHSRSTLTGDASNQPRRALGRTPASRSQRPSGLGSRPGLHPSTSSGPDDKLWTPRHEVRDRRGWVRGAKDLSNPTSAPAEPFEINPDWGRLERNRGGLSAGPSASGGQGPSGLGSRPELRPSTSSGPQALDPRVTRSETVGVGFEALRIFQTPPAPQPNHSRSTLTGDASNQPRRALGRTP